VVKKSEYLERYDVVLLQKKFRYSATKTGIAEKFSKKKYPVEM
jgi:hypothetical protein